MDVWDAVPPGCTVSMVTGTIFGLFSWRLSHGNRHKVRINIDII